MMISVDFIGESTRQRAEPGQARLRGEFMKIPKGLEWWRSRPGGAEWLARLPALVAECAELWQLDVQRPFPGAHVSLVAPAVRADGTRAVLKVNFPDVWENEQEGDALAHWDGRGAVRLLEHDRERRALLLERCQPGTPLSTVHDEEAADRIAAEILRRLWRPPPDDHPFTLLADDAARWAEGFPATWRQLGRPFEESLVVFAVAAAEELARSQGEPVVLHQDFHGGNVLRARREGWLAIDPQPLVGEREYDAASLLRDRSDELLRDGRPRRRIRRRLDRISVALEVDRERVRRWGVVHALAWGVSGVGKVEAEMVACARMLARI